MEAYRIVDLLHRDWIGKEVVINGWVRTFRSNRFIALNDGSSQRSIQCVVDFEAFDDSLLKQISTGAAVRVTGTVVESMGRGQEVEIQVKDLFVHGGADPDQYPIQPKKQHLPFTTISGKMDSIISTRR